MWNYINSDYFTNKAFVVMHVPGKHGLFGEISLEVTSLTIAVSQPFWFGCRDTLNILVFLILLLLFAKCSGMKQIDFIYLGWIVMNYLVHAWFSFTFNYQTTIARRVKHVVSGFLQVQLYRSLDFRLASQIQGSSTHWFGGAFRLGLFNSQV